MSRENASYELNTIKGHGLSIGDRFNFHGMASDAWPTPQGTRVELGKVGNKYMLTTVTGEVHTWEFGPSAKVWADTTVKHHITTATRTLDNGDVIHTAECEHGWMTGFHTSAEDAYAVAEGHGDVTRPLYAAPVIEVTPADITGADVEAARVAVRDNGRVFAAEVHNFGGQAAFDILVESGTHTLVNDGDMSRYIRTMRTADGEPITDGMAVWDYNLNPGRVVLSSVDRDGWFNVDTVKGTRSLMNAERVYARHPYSRVAAKDAVAAMASPVREAFGPLPLVSPGDALVEVPDGYFGSDVPLEIPTNAEVDAMRAGIDPYADQITEDAWTGAGVVVTASGKTLWTETRNGVTRVKGKRGTYTEWDAVQFGELFDLGVLSRPEVRLSPRVRALVNRRKRKASKVNARRVRGGF